MPKPKNRIEDWTLLRMDDRAVGAVLEEGEESPKPKWLQRLEQLLVDHPRTTVLASVALGLTLGWLGKRK